MHETTIDTDIEALRSASIHRQIGPTILLGSGALFDFGSPETSEITIEDVAYGLGYACRFAGQCWSRIHQRRVFYSVAEHCVRMSFQAPPNLQYEALMHELGEPVCGDVTGPLKSICPDYKAMEKRCEAAIGARFGVAVSDPAAIKMLDLRMLATERRDLMRWSGEQPWRTAVEPFEMEIDPWSPDEIAQIKATMKYTS